MFAVVRTGGKQYRVAPGDKIVVEKLDGNAGDKITLATPARRRRLDLKSTDGLTVAAEIIAQAKGEKVTVFKKRRRHNYRRKKGHRQQHTILRIVSIGDHKAEKAEAAPKAEGPKAAPKPLRRQRPRLRPATSKGGEAAGKPTENPAPDNAKAKAEGRAEEGREEGRPAKAPPKPVDKKCCTC